MFPTRPRSTKVSLESVPMPPIAGVAFGPLVLQDVMFKNMDLSMLEMVLAPKVTSASAHRTSLGPGQPAGLLHVLLLFHGLRQSGTGRLQRCECIHTRACSAKTRSVDLASTIDIGAVFGVYGFIARAGREHEYDVVAYFKLSDHQTRGEDAAGAIGSVKDQLLKAETMEDVCAIILDGLSGRIRGALQLTAVDERVEDGRLDQGAKSRA